MAACTTTGTITFATDCDDDFGPNGTASVSGSTLTITDETFDDPNDGVSSFSRIVLKAGSETGGAINIGVDLTGTTYVDSHNSAAVYLLTKKGNITVDIGEDVILNAQQSGVFAKADNSGSTAGGIIIVTNYGTITAGEQSGDFGSEGIRVRSLQGEGTIYNYGSVTSVAGRGLRIDGGSVAGVSDSLIVNDGTVDAWLDGVHINGKAGAATIENGLDGVITSRTQRGVVASSTSDAATLTNEGEITSLLAAGALVWGAKDAAATNSGTIAATVVDGDDSNDFLHFGVQVWSQDEGSASLVNEAGGTIIAHDGWAAWLLSTDGDVTIDNAGTLLGKSTAVYVGADKITEQWNENPVLADHAGAVGGDLTLTNSGIITADETADFTNGMALITFAGYELGEVSLTNLAGGFIGAGFVEDTDFSLEALAGLSGSQWDALDAAASNAALSFGVETEDGASIVNAGTLVGRVAVGTPFDMFGSGPDYGSDASLMNSGLWVTSGTSSLEGTFTNSGNIFAVGETTLSGALANSGAVWLRGTSSDVADLTIEGDYTASGDATFQFDIGADGTPVVNITGAVSGQTQVVLANLGDWDWKNYESQTLIDIADSTPEYGADSFELATPILGLVKYSLSYDDTDYLWSLSTEVSEQSVEETSDVAQTVTATLSTVTSDLLNRTDDLRDMFWGPEETKPTAYAAEISGPAEEAFAALAPTGEATLRTWAKVQGAIGTGTDYDGRQRSTSFGADITSGRDGDLLAAGVFGAMTGTSLDYAGSTSSAELSGRAFGVYGTMASSSGLFTSAVLAVEATDIDLVLSGEAASFNAWTMGGRLDVGYLTQVGDVALEPSVGVRFGTASYDDFIMSDTTVSIDISLSSAVEARLRMSRSYAFEDMDLAPFAVLSLGISQSSNGTMSLSDIGAEGAAEDEGAYGGIALGLQSTSLDGKVVTFARGDVTVTEDSRWAALKLGGSYKF